MWLSNGTAGHEGGVWRDICHDSCTPTATITSTTTADQTPKAHHKSKRQDLTLSRSLSLLLFFDSPGFLNELSVTVTLQEGCY